MEVHNVCKIDKDKFKSISDDIATDEVIITDERIEHIIQRRGGEFYSRYASKFVEILEEPDYIFADKKNTALVCKHFEDDGKNVNIALRLTTSSDDSKYKNSIITAISESDKRFQQRLRNNIPVYKKE
jgi:hypothetical protein